MIFRVKNETLVNVQRHCVVLTACQTPSGGGFASLLVVLLVFCSLFCSLFLPFWLARFLGVAAPLWAPLSVIFELFYLCLPFATIS
jgi:hypothetical protein